MLASERAYQVLRGKIIGGDLRPGTALGEVEVAEQLGISRTPVREAIGRLLGDGLIEQHGRGAVVSGVSVDTIADLYNVRLPLEQQAVRLAAAHRDAQVFDRLHDEFLGAAALLGGADPQRRLYYDLVDRFDDAVDEAAGNAYLLQVMNLVRTHFVRIRHMARSDTRRLLAAAEEHALIVAAIRDGDGDLAAAATRVHLHKSMEHRLRRARTLRTLSPVPDPTTDNEGVVRETA